MAANDEGAPVRIRDGYCAAYGKGDGCYRIAFDEWDRLRAAFLSGTAILETRGTFGQPIIVRLNGSEAISRFDAASIEAHRLDARLTEEEERAARMLHGED